MNNENKNILAETSARASKRYWAMNAAADEGHGTNIILMEVLKQLLEMKELLQLTISQPKGEK